jgi:hypothetical protein
MINYINSVEKLKKKYNTGEFGKFIFIEFQQNFNIHFSF